MKTLGDVAEWGSGGTPRRGVAEYFGEGTPWLSIADLNDGVVCEARESLTAAGIANSSAKVVPAGTVFVAMYGSIGKLGVAGREMCTSQAIAFAKPRAELVDRQYLFNYLMAQRPALLARGRGGTQMNIGQGDLKAWPIPLPPLDEQRRIAAILDHADALRAKRRQVFAHLDALTRSIFHDMFVAGAVWPSVVIGSLGTITTGRTPPTARAGMFGGPIPFVTPGDLGSGVPVARSLTNEGAVESRVVRTGATLVCCIGATIGKVGNAGEPSALNQQINAVEWGSSINELYGLEVMRRLKPTIVARAASTTLPLLPKGQFSKLQIPVPPLELQAAFASRMQQIFRQRGSVGKAQSAEHGLFSSLQSRAFRGEL